MKKQIKEFKDNDLFISLDVYKFPLGNCGGITDIEKNIWIPCKQGYMKFSEIENKELIFIPEYKGDTYFCLKPLIQPTDMLGPMAGGNLAYSSDSRCDRVYHIHDRFETQAQYDQFSN